MEKVKPCQTVKELYLRPSRALISEAIPSFFETHCISVTELLHNSDWVRTLEDSGMMMQTIIQRAVLQGASFGGDLRDDKARLEKLIREGTTKLRTDTQNELFPALKEPAEFAALADKCTHIPQGNYVLSGAIARHLRPARNVNIRLVKLTEMLNAATPQKNESGEKDPERPGRALMHETIDDMVSEILAIPRVVPELIGDVPNFGTRIYTCALWYLGRPVRGQFGEGQALDKLAGCFARGDLPLSHMALARMIVQDITSSEPLLNGIFLHELKSFRQLSPILGQCVGPHLSRRDLLTAMNTRSARLATTDHIRDSMNALQTMDDKVQKLFFIESCITDPRSRYAIADMIFRFATAESFSLRFQTTQIPLTKRLHRLTQLNQYALNSRFDKDQKLRMAAIFDNLAFAQAEEARLFDIILAQKSTPAQKFMMICKLFAAGNITEGKLSAKARKTVQALLKQDGFISGYAIAANLPEAGDVTGDLREKLKAIGMNPDDALMLLRGTT